ncbi:nuclear transport factor 2 family protein [Vibrio makurazakiensis]|uniref:nuclear transport factor 2 family protein n=1 Tax=Vibrio makurazakiensis TaxID=2910250 RepID=UPI003D14B077
MTDTFTEAEQETIRVVDAQLAAYNARDIDAFIACYHDDIEISLFSVGIQIRGKQALKERYEQKFEGLKYLHASALKRIVQGRYLVDHELAESASQSPDKIDNSVRVIAAYEVQNGKIVRVSFMG